MSKRNGKDTLLVVNNVLKQARLAKNLTQAAVASRVGLSRPAYANVERGRKNPSLEVAIRLAELLGHPVEELFAVSEVHTRESKPETAGRKDGSGQDWLCRA